MNGLQRMGKSVIIMEAGVVLLFQNAPNLKI